MLKIFYAAFVFFLFSNSIPASARENTDPIEPKEPISTCHFGEKKELPSNLLGTWSSPGGYQIFKKNGNALSKGLGPNGTYLKEKYRVICIKDGIIHLLLGFKPFASKKYRYSYTNITQGYDKNYQFLWDGMIVTQDDADKMSDEDLFLKFKAYHKNQDAFSSCDNATCKINIKSSLYRRDK